MGLLGVMLLAVSLSMDALGVGISYGIRGVKTPWTAKMIICFLSILFTGMAVALGNMVLVILPEVAAKFIGSGMLVILGAVIIFQAFFKKEQKEEKEEASKPIKQKLLDLPVKPLGITIKIIKNEVTEGFEKTKRVDALEAVYLGVALSIDSFAAGISSAVSGVNSILIPFAAGFCQLLFLCIGDFSGKRLSLLSKIDSKVFVVISGILLIILAGVRAFC